MTEYKADDENSHATGATPLKEKFLAVHGRETSKAKSFNRPLEAQQSANSLSQYENDPVVIVSFSLPYKVILDADQGITL